MKVLLINGSPNEHGCTYMALCEAADVFSKNGIETEILYLGKAPGRRLHRLRRMSKHGTLLCR